MAKKQSRNAPKAPYIYKLDPEEWDFRFVRLEELEAVTVYEYARSCPWVRLTWERWLDQTMPYYNARGTTPLGMSERPIRDVIRNHFDSSVPLWDQVSVEAEAVMHRMPALLGWGTLDYLVCCTPSFPVRWAKLPPEEKTAALSLVKAGLPPFRDTARPAWSARSTFLVAVDLDADFKELRKAAERWLSAKKDAYDLQRRRSGELRETSGQKQNIGRRNAPRWEALSWLGAYRFSEARITYPQAEKEVGQRRNDLRDPAFKRYPRLWTDEMNCGTWSDWAAKARTRMEAMFKPRPFSPPNCRLPHLRWDPS